MRDFGAVQSPQSAFILNLGLESLHVRMPRHVENAQAISGIFGAAAAGGICQLPRTSIQ